MTLKGMRYELGKCRDSAHKQIGLRAVKDALALGDRNLPRTAELRAIASHHLALAQATDEFRAAER